jgi:capsular exopolysaccharide synthesis family protein
MELRDYAEALRKFWLLLVVLAVVGAGAGFAIAQATPPTYRATSKVFVSVEQGETVTELVQGSTFAQNIVQSYAQLATMPVVLDPVIARLGLDVTARELARTVTADTPLNTVIVEISATSGDPVEAAAISNATAQSLATTVHALSPDRADGTSSIAVRTVSPADPPVFPIAPNTRFMTATGLLVGLLLGMGVALVAQVLDTKVRTEKDIERVTDTAVLGTVAQVRGQNDRRAVMLVRPRSQQAEAYRKIRANLQFVDAAHEVRSLVVTSARAGEGKTTTITNLALAMAETGSRVLVIDADLRRPMVATVCGLEGSAGLTTVLIGSASVDDVLQDWGDTGVAVLTAGAIPPNPLQLLDSEHMARLLEDLTQRFDVVLLDAPPVLPVADAAVLSRLCSGVIVVAGAGRATRHLLRKALASLESVGANVLGVVLARASKRDVSEYYGYGYHDDAGSGTSAGSRRRRSASSGRGSAAPATGPSPVALPPAPAASAPGGALPTPAQGSGRAAPAGTTPAPARRGQEAAAPHPRS